MTNRLFATRIAKVVPRIPAIVRKYSAVATPEGLSPFAAERLAVEEHAKSTAKTWKNITIYVCLPALLLGTANSYRIMKEHEAHKEHEHEHEDEDHPLYQYQRIRTKPFPWGDGDKTLFHNPAVNK